MNSVFVLTIYYYITPTPPTATLFSFLQKKKALRFGINITLLSTCIQSIEKLDELYKKYGYCLNTLHFYEFEGSAGFAKMQGIMKDFRGDIKTIGGRKVEKVLDYAPGLDGLPKSDVLKFLLEGNCSVVVRPSGTEPKLKAYLSVTADSMEEAARGEKQICEDLDRYFG